MVGARHCYRSEFIVQPEGCVDNRPVPGRQFAAAPAGRSEPKGHSPANRVADLIAQACRNLTVEPGAMDHGGAVLLDVRSEEDRSTKDALERSDQPAVLRTALLDAEGIKHLGSAVERDPGGFLPNRHRRQEDRNQAILSPGQSIARVTSDLEDESPVPSFVKEASGWRALHRQPAKDERP